MTLREQILEGLTRGPATLPKVAPKALRPMASKHAILRYVTARQLEHEGLIARVGTIRTQTMRGGLRRIVWRLTQPHEG